MPAPSRAEAKPRARGATRRLLLEFIRTYTLGHGYPPSIREIGAGCGLAKSGVSYQLGMLVQEGAIRRRPYCHRSYVVIEPAAGS